RALHSGRSRRGWLLAADVHGAGAGPTDALLRDHPAARRPWLRGRQLPGALRGHRVTAVEARKFVEALTPHPLPQCWGRGSSLRSSLMPSYYRLGEVPPKRHTQFRSPSGQLYAEEVFATEGFSGN